MRLLTLCGMVDNRIAEFLAGSSFALCTSSINWRMKLLTDYLFEGLRRMFEQRFNRKILS